MSASSLPPIKTTLAAGIQRKLLQFRRSVRISKTAETFSACVICTLLLYLIVLGSDRFIDTSVGLRVGILLVTSSLIATYVPWMLHRWVWNTRRLTQVARLLSKPFPRLADQVLSVVELASAKDEQRRSPQLVAAAMAQVERRLESVDLTPGVPKSRSKRFAICAFLLGGISLAAVLVVPQVAWNALERTFMPWRSVERFTFTLLEPVPQSIVVPYGEPFDFIVSLKPESDWHPVQGQVNVNSVIHKSSLGQNQFEFALPGLLEPTQAYGAIGDASFSVRIEPLARPELVELSASVELPSYLQYTEPLNLDARSGSVYALVGSRVQIKGNANRPLNLVTMNSKEIAIDGARFSSAWHVMEQATEDAAQEFVLEWKDEHGLHASSPKTLRLRVTNDKLPGIACTGLSQQSIWLSTDTLKFEVSADDDYGLKCVGIQWHSIPNSTATNELQSGERVILSGAPQSKRIGGQATFNCSAEKLEPQVLELRAFAEDYRGETGRAYSVPYRIQFMSAAEHAEWLTQQMRRWKGKLDSVYDEELRLLDENQEIRDSMQAEPADSDVAERLKRQATAEINNAAKLQATAEEGKELLQQALRNEEIRAQQIEQWAEALNRLNKLAEGDMPAVAEQLESAASAGEGRPDAGSVGHGAESKRESSMEKSDSQQPSQSQSEGGEGASLPEARLGPGLDNAQPNPNPANDKNTPTEKMDAAVRDQTKVIEEFRKAREAFGDLLSQLENSTFIKRLKAASDVEKQLAGKLNSIIGQSFGRKATELDDTLKQDAANLTQPLQQMAENVERILRDLEGYQRDYPDATREEVIKDMQERDTIVKLQEMPLRLSRNLRGDSLHRTEFWADTFDRWAEELAGPGPQGQGGEGDDAPKDRLPPALLLDILRIIYDEIDLREETRTLGQVKADSDANREELTQRLSAQAVQQMYIQERTLNAINDVRALPEGARKFADELQKLGKAVQHMDDASAMLSDGNTSDEVIAAETAAIEALIAARRGGGGGGGGGDSGGGSNAGGSTNRSAMELIGPGADKQAKVLPRQVGEGTGKAGRQLPEEYREGLDAFLNKIDQLRGNR